MAGTITTVVKALFQSQGADKVASDIKKVGQAGEEISKKQTRLGNESTNTGRAFASQASGLGGLVAAYAGAAATLFALQQGFSALKTASQSEQLFSGLNQLAANIGESGPKILASINQITRGQIAAASAAEKANLALSSGFSGDKINDLANIATRASRVLGRDLEDSFTRLIRGTTKLEPELLDELGIFTRIEPAVQAYAAQIGKSETSLTNFERRQAFLNAVIEEGTRKFKSVNVTVPTAAESLNQLSARLIDLTTQFGLFLATAATPFVNFFSQNIAGAFGLFALLSRTVVGKGLDVLQEKFTKTAERAKAFGEKFSNISRDSGASKAAIQELSKVSGSLGGNFIGVTGESKKTLASLKELAVGGQLTIQQTKEYSKLLTTNRDALQNTVTKHVLLRDALAKDSEEYKSKDKVVKNYTTQLEKAQAALDASNASLKVAPGIAGIAEKAFSGLSKTIQGFSIVIGGVVRTVNFLLLAIGGLATVGGIFASIYGKEAELGAFTEKLGKFFKELLTGSESAKEFRVGLAGGVNYFFGELEKSNQRLKEIDKFQFKTKFLGVSITFTKTKEDLAKEVQDISRQAIEGQNIGDKIVNNLGASIGGGLVGAIGVGLAGGLAGAKLGGLLGTTLGGPVGAVLGGAIGLAAGAAIAATLVSKDDATQASIQQAQRALGVTSETDNVKALAKAYDEVNKKQKEAGVLGETQKLYFDAQKELITNLIKNRDLLSVLGNVAAETGISIDGLFKSFNKSIVDTNQLLNTLKATLKDLSGDKSLEVSFLNTKKIDQELAAVVTKVQEAIKTVNKQLNNRERTFELRLGPREVRDITEENARTNLGDLMRGKSNLLERRTVDIETARNRINRIMERSRPREEINRVIAFEEALITRRYQSQLDNQNRQIELYEQVIRQAERAREVETGRLNVLNNVKDLLNKNMIVTESAARIQNNLVGATNLQVDLQDELNSGLLTREQISQRVFNVNKLLARAQSDILKDSEQESQLNALDSAVISLRILGRIEEATQLAKVVQATRDNLEANKKNYGEIVKANTALSIQAKQQDAILQTSELLRKTFQQELASVDKLNFLFDKNFNLAKHNEEIDANRLQFLSDSIALSKDALALETELSRTKVKIGDQEKTLREVAIEDLNRIESIDDELKNKRKAFAGATVQLAALGRDTNRILAGLFQKTIIEAQTLARELEKQAKELQAKTTEAALQNQLQAAKDRLAAEQQRISIYEKERGLLNELADAQVKARDIEIERQKIAQTRSLLFAKEISSNDVLGNFFTDQQKQQIEIKIAEADLRALEDTTRNQIDAIRRKAESDEMAIKEQMKSNEEQSKLRLSILDKERALNVTRLEGERAAAEANLEIQKLKINALIEESKILKDHVAGIAKVLLDDRLERELAMEGGPARVAERMNIRGPGDPGELGPLITDRNRITEILKTRIESEIGRTIDATRTSLQGSLNKIEELTKATNGLYGTQIAGVNATAQAARTREQEQAAADKRELERRLLINAQVAQNDIQTLQNRLAEARNSYERLTEIAKLSNNVGIQIASDFVKNIRDNVGKALQDLGQAILEGTLTLKNFAEGARDVFIKILRDLGTSIFQRLVVAPIQNFLVESLSKPIMEFFGINTNAPIEANTAAIRELTTAITSRMGATPGATPGGAAGEANKFQTGDPIGPQVAAQQKQAAEASEGFGDKLKTLGVNFQTVGAVAIGTFGAVLAATGNWKKAFLATILTTFSTMITQIIMKSGFAGVGSAFSGAFSGIGSSISSFFSSPGVMASASGPLYSAVGGPVRHMATGGYAGLRDRVPALLEPGEFVIRRPAAMAIGGQTLNQMNATGQPGPGNVTVNMSNQGTPQEIIGTPKVSMNGRDMIVDIVVKDIQNNGPIRKTLRGGM